jgi:hypothetical protein
MTDLGHQPSVDRRNKGIKVQQQQALEGLRKIMQDDGSRRYLGELVRDGQLFQRDHATRPEDIQFNAGRRATAMKIMEDVVALDGEDPKKPHLQALIAATFRPAKAKPEKDTDERSPDDSE